MENTENKSFDQLFPHAKQAAQYSKDREQYEKPWDLWEIGDENGWRKASGQPVWFAELKYWRNYQTGEWIPVDIQYPRNDTQEVIVLLSDGSVRIALYTTFTPLGRSTPVHYFTGDIYHVDGIEYNCTDFDNVTHWQPLPEPPKLD